MALITLDNGEDYTRPNTLGPLTLHELNDVLDELTARAAAGEIKAVGITGKQFIFAAGADLSKVSTLANRENAKLMVQYGHWVLGKLNKLGVPSFSFVNGLALGGAMAVSYTHLDVYKRQPLNRIRHARRTGRCRADRNSRFVDAA